MPSPDPTSPGPDPDPASPDPASPDPARADPGPASTAQSGPGMSIDAHVHLWDLAARPQPWTDDLPALQRSFGLDDVAADLHAAGIGGVIAVQCIASYAETLDLLALASRRPLLAGVVGWVDLARPDAADQLRAARAAPGGAALVGARHQLQTEPDGSWLARSQVQSGLRALAAAGLAYDLVISPGQLPLVTRVVAALPEVRFVLDHAGKPPIAAGDLAAWTADISRLAARPNVAVKLSGLVTEADWKSWRPEQLRPVLDHVLAQFGPGRAMFGSDWPVCLLAASYAQVVDTVAPVLGELSGAERAAVLGGTARTWYRLAGR